MDEYDSFDVEELEKRGFTVFDIDPDDPTVKRDDYEDEYDFIDDQEFGVCPTCEAMSKVRKDVVKAFKVPKEYLK